MRDFSLSLSFYALNVQLLNYFNIYVFLQYLYTILIYLLIFINAELI